MENITINIAGGHCIIFAQNSDNSYYCYALDIFGVKTEIPIIISLSGSLNQVVASCSLPKHGTTYKKFISNNLYSFLSQYSNQKVAYPIQLLNLQGIPVLLCSPYGIKGGGPKKAVAGVSSGFIFAGGVAISFLSGGTLAPFVAAGLMGGGISTAVYTASKNEEDINAKEFLTTAVVSTASGILSGGVGSVATASVAATGLVATTGTGAAIISGAAGGVSGSVLNKGGHNLAKGKEFFHEVSSKEVLLSGLTGCISGAVSAPAEMLGDGVASKIVSQNSKVIQKGISSGVKGASSSTVGSAVGGAVKLTTQDKDEESLKGFGKQILLSAASGALISGINSAGRTYRTLKNSQVDLIKEKKAADIEEKINFDDAEPNKKNGASNARLKKIEADNDRFNERDKSKISQGKTEKLLDDLSIDPESDDVDVQSSTWTWLYIPTKVVVGALLLYALFRPLPRINRENNERYDDGLLNLKWDNLYKAPKLNPELVDLLNQFSKNYINENELALVFKRFSVIDTANEKQFNSFVNPSSKSNSFVKEAANMLNSLNEKIGDSLNEIGTISNKDSSSSDFLNQVGDVLDNLNPESRNLLNRFFEKLRSIENLSNFENKNMGGNNNHPKNTGGDDANDKADSSANRKIKGKESKDHECDHLASSEANIVILSKEQIELQIKESEEYMKLFEALTNCAFREYTKHAVLVHALGSSEDGLHLLINQLAIEQEENQSLKLLKFCITKDGKIGSHISIDKDHPNNGLPDRPTLHFSVNQLVQPHSDSWENNKVAILIPLSTFEQYEQCASWGIATYDTMIIGPVKIPNNSVILVPNSIKKAVKDYFISSYRSCVEGYADNITLRQAIMSVLNSKRFSFVWHICDKDGNLLGNRVKKTPCGYERETYMLTHTNQKILLFSGSGGKKEGHDSDKALFSLFRNIKEIRMHHGSFIDKFERNKPKSIRVLSEYRSNLTLYEEERIENKPSNYLSDFFKKKENVNHFSGSLKKDLFSIVRGKDTEDNSFVVIGILVLFEKKPKLNSKTSLDKFEKNLILEAITADAMSLIFSSQEAIDFSYYQIKSFGCQVYEKARAHIERFLMEIRRNNKYYASKAYKQYKEYLLEQIKILSKAKKENKHCLNRMKDHVNDHKKLMPLEREISSKIDEAVDEIVISFCYDPRFLELDVKFEEKKEYLEMSKLVLKQNKDIFNKKLDLILSSDSPKPAPKLLPILNKIRLTIQGLKVLFDTKKTLTNLEDKINLARFVMLKFVLKKIENECFFSRYKYFLEKSNSNAMKVLNAQELLPAAASLKEDYPEPKGNKAKGVSDGLSLGSSNVLETRALAIF